MEVILNRDAFLKGLQMVQNIVEPRQTLPILANVLLETDGDTVRLTATDLEVGARVSVPARVAGKGAITVSARKLAEIVRELPNASIRLTASGEQRITIECGRSRFKLLGLPKDEFPAFPAVKFETGWRATAGNLQKLIQHVAFAASTEESRPILNGVLWELRPDRMRMVATNGHRLARMDVPTATARESTPVAATNAAASAGSVRTPGACTPSLPPTSPSSASTTTPRPWQCSTTARVAATFSSYGRREPSYMTLRTPAATASCTRSTSSAWSRWTATGTAARRARLNVASPIGSRQW